MNVFGMEESMPEYVVEGRGEAAAEITLAIEGDTINIAELECVVGCAATDVWNKPSNIHAPAVPDKAWYVRLRVSPCDYLDTPVRSLIEPFVKRHDALNAYCDEHELRVVVYVKITGDSEWIEPTIEPVTVKGLSLINAELMIRTIAGGPG